MLRTIREAISEVMNDLRVLNVDEYIPKKYIHHKLISFTQTLVKRDSDNRRLFQQRYLYKSIPCMELEEMSYTECCEYDLGVYILRTKDKIPKTLSTIYKSGITVLPILNNNILFKETTPTAYRDIKRRKYRSPNVIYFWISDDRLCFPETTIGAVRVEGMFIDTDTLNKLIDKDKCIPILDSEFICPDYLFEDVKKMTTMDILQSYSKPSDEVPDMNSNNKQVNP